MAKVQNNVMMRGLSGTLGGFVVRHMRDGRTLISAMPDFSQRRFSKDQRAHQSRFKEASAYAREAAKEKPIYAELAQGTSRNAYNLALSDWFNPPIIHRIEIQGEVIRVQAGDNVLVTRVSVLILDEQGHILEAGEASQVDAAANPGWWEYTPQEAGQTVAEAFDLAGNQTRIALER